MSDSVYQAFFTAVFIVIFIAATTITVTLFTSAMDYSEKAFEYGKLTSSDSIVETNANVENYNIISGSELLTYYYNYVDDDKYGYTKPNEDYIFLNIEKLEKIDVIKKYYLEYIGFNEKKNKGIIEVKEFKEEKEE